MKKRGFFCGGCRENRICENSRENAGGGKLGFKTVRRGLAVLLAGCLLTGALAACGGDDKEKESSSGMISGLATAAPVASATPAVPQTAKAVKVKVDDGLNVRKAASTEGEILGQVQDEDKLPLLVDTPQDGWYQVQYEGQTAYVSAEFVEVVDITVEQYNALMATPSPEPSATAEPSGSPDPAASATPGAESTPAGGQTNSGMDNEDGE